MNNIIFRYYNNLAEYENLSKRRNVRSDWYKTSKEDLIRCAYTVGKSARVINTLPQELIDYKKAFINLHLSFTGNIVQYRTDIINDYFEQSEKTASMYYIGMLFAQSFVQKNYNVRHLMHLKSDDIHFYPEKGKTPDLWGVNLKTGQSYLVEAKGTATSANFFDVGPIREAFEQLKEVDEIVFSLNEYIEGGLYSGDNLKKIAIGTHPNAYGLVTQQVVDPTEGNGRRAYISSESLISEYYASIMEELKSREKQIVQINNVEYLTVYIKHSNLTVGLPDSIYNLLRSSDYMYYRSDSDMIFKKINEILDEINNSNHNEDKYEEDKYKDKFKEVSNNISDLDENYYVGIDGIHINIHENHRNPDEQIFLTNIAGILDKLKQKKN